jgi:hypothetical protein
MSSKVSEETKELEGGNKCLGGQAAAARGNATDNASRLVGTAHQYLAGSSVLYFPSIFHHVFGWRS